VQSGQSKDHNIGMCFFSAKFTTLMSKNKVWLAMSPNNVWIVASVR
jgi:hypothetical protein